ncbi:MAG TPA: ATP-dependent DNA helicase, partial [Pseudolysinimonas sp.]|nr:ATP-dependent DNA helicase [Pseudolysinimonas sp.]
VSGLGFELDASQLAVVGLPDRASAAVMGAPGSGKTTTIIELVADRVLNRGWDPRSVLVLTSARASATRLRDQIAVRLGVPTDGPLARTAASLAYEIVGVSARAAGTTPPRLVTGAEQDADLAALLEGHIDARTGPAWPDPLTPEVRRTTRFRSELRDLFSRATEQGVDPGRLRELGRATGRPEWVAAGDFFDEYLDVIASARPEQRDPAELARLAIATIDGAGGPGARGEVSAGGERVAGLRLVIIDDLPEATEATLALLAALARRGIPVIAFGDPDVAVNAFRGGEPDALGRLASVLGIRDIPTLVLDRAHRPNTVLRDFTGAVTERIGTAAAGGQRRAVAERPATDRPPLARIEAPTAARTAALIARALREEHVLHGVPWSRLAVVVRSGAAVPTLARSLALAEVPTRTGGGGLALREDAAARALLAVVETGTGRLELTADLAGELLTGPFGGLDPIGLRRLKIALRTEEALAAGSRADGMRPSGELLVEALAAPGRFATIDAPVARTAERLAATLDALRTADPTATAEELLWLAWDRSRLAGPWRTQALGSGVAAAEANRDLDGIVGLFAAAKRFAERRPDVAASEFFAELRDSDVSEDLIVPTRNADAVLVTTPSGAVGLEFDTVVVAGLQDGAWPNRRPRGTLLAPQALARAASGDDGVLDERRLVLDDELRMFALAVSRARDRVLLAAVVNDDESRSALVDLLPPDTPLLAEGSPLTLRGTTGRLRRLLTSRGVDVRTRTAAASSLAHLAELGVPGANPDDWHGLLAPSSEAPLFDGLQVPVSPSRLERFEESPLDWFLETIGGSSSTTLMDVGTILHWAMETAESPDADAVWRQVEKRWGELLFESPWLAEHHRRSARVLADGIAAYLGDVATNGVVAAGAELSFEFEIDRALLRGKTDRVERARDGSVMIVDLKTGSPVTNQAKVDATAQLGAYQLAYREGLFDDVLADLGEHRPGGAKLLYVKSGVDGKRYREGVQAPLGEEGLEAFRERIRQVAIGMAAASFEGVLEVGGYGLGAVPELRLHRVGAVSGP